MLRISQELASASQALPLANAAATSIYALALGAFEALEHSRRHPPVTRAADSIEFERTPGTVTKSFFPNASPERGSESLGDENLDGGVMRRGHATKSGGCQIPLKLLALVLSTTRQAT